jgi:hypothetical protein
MSVLLFVGGVADGRRIVVKDDCDCISIPHPRMKTQALLDVDLPHPPVCPVMVQDNYRQERIRGCTVEFTVMLFDEMTPDDLIRSLINNYPRSEA